MLHLNYKDKVIEVFETKDLKQYFNLISEKSKDYLITNNRIKKGKKKYYTYPCAFDIETTTIVKGDYAYDGDTPIGIPYLFQFNVFNYVYICRTYEECTYFFNALSSVLKTNVNQLYFFVHNLNYEFQFLKDIWNIKEVFAVDAHHPLTVELINGITFRDSYKLTNMSLELFTKNWSTFYFKESEIMDYKIKRFPHTEIDNNTMLYSVLDVLSLSDALINFLQANNVDTKTTAVTSTGFTRKAIRKACLPKYFRDEMTEEQKEYKKVLMNSKINLPLYSLLVSERKGGNTHANIKYIDKVHKNIMHFDYTSSYPTQMICYSEYPVGRWYHLGNYKNGINRNTIFEKESNGECTLSKFLFINLELKDGCNCPPISRHKIQVIPQSEKIVVHSGRYIKGAFKSVLTLFGNEFIELIDKYYYYDNVIVLDSWSCRKGYLPMLFRKEILEYYKKKTELKGIEGKEAEYAVSKANVNSIYGCCYTDPIRDTYNYNGLFIEHEVFNKDILEEINNINSKPNYFAPYTWGAMTAVLGQIMLYKLIEVCGDDFIYCDTDSVFCFDSKELREKIKKFDDDLYNYHSKCGLNITAYDKHGKPHTLGRLDEEEHLKEFKTLGAKKYAMLTDSNDLTITIAGVPKKNGAKTIKCVDDLKIGMTFYGKDTGKMTSTYNTYEKSINVEIENHIYNVYSNIGLTECDYLMGIEENTLGFFMTQGNYDEDNYEYELKKEI